MIYELNKKHQINILRIANDEKQGNTHLEGHFIYDLTYLWTNWQKYVNQTSWFGNVWRIEASCFLNCWKGCGNFRFVIFLNKICPVINIRKFFNYLFQGNVFRITPLNRAKAMQMFFSALPKLLYSFYNTVKSV